MTIPFYRSRRVVDNTGSVTDIELEFKAEQAADVHLYAGESADPELPNIVELVQGVNYTVSGIGTLDLVATVTNPSGWSNYSFFVLTVEYTVTQPNDVDVGGPFGLRFENALDRQTFMLQSFSDDVSRSIKLPLTTPVGLDLTLEPAPGQILGWNDDGTAIIAYPTVTQSTLEAQQAADEANDAADDAEGFASNAQGFATLSSQWAQNPEDVPVVTGPDKFSALHWAAKAAASAAAAAASVAAVIAGFANAINTAAAKAVPVAADRIGFYDTVGAALKRITFGELVTWLYPQVGPEYIVGLTCSSNTGTPNTHMDVLAGEHRKGGLFGTAVAMTKRIDQVWAAGNNGGWRDSATAVAANTTYFIFSIRNNSTGALDTLSSASPTAPTVPGGYTLVGRVDMVVTNASGFLIQRARYGNKVVYKAPIAWFSGGVDSAVTLLAVSGAPVGVENDVLLSGSITSTGPNADGVMHIWDALVGSGPASGGAGLHIRARGALASEVAATYANTVEVRCNASGQVYRIASVSGTVVYAATVEGFIDFLTPRGSV